MTREEQQAFFDERAAILEIDHGLPRAEAEAQAVRELYDALQARAPMGILAELARAGRVRHSPALADCLQACGLVDVRGPAWGFDWCVFDGPTYRPADPDELGRSCLIVPATKEATTLKGEITDVVADLVAMDIADRRTAARLGVADVVGFNAVEVARVNGWPLFVFPDVLTWLRGGSRGAVIVDWSRAAAALEGVSTIVSCGRLAKQLHAATAQCWPRPDIIITEKVGHGDPV